MNTYGNDKPVILIDPSELQPLRFSSAVATQRALLPVGHYSLRGSSPHVAVDRYALAGFARLVADHEAFRERCRRLAERDVRVIVVEAAPTDAGRMAPHALAALEGCGVPVWWTCTQRGATRKIEALLTLVWQQQRQRAGVGPAQPVLTGGPRPHVVSYDLADGENPPTPLGAA